MLVSEAAAAELERVIRQHLLPHALSKQTHSIGTCTVSNFYYSQYQQIICTCTWGGAHISVTKFSTVQVLRGGVGFSFISLLDNCKISCSLVIDLAMGMLTATLSIAHSCSEERAVNSRFNHAVRVSYQQQQSSFQVAKFRKAPVLGHSLDQEQH